MTEALYNASDAGVQIDMIIRGSRAVRAGVPGLSENIRVRSILGRYLEHSRIYRFAHGDVDDQPLYLIGSADLMPRNLDRRVEVLVPIEHPKHREWLDQVFELPARRRHRALGAAARRHVVALRPPRRVRAPPAGAALPLGGRTPGDRQALAEPQSAVRSRPCPSASFTVVHLAPGPSPRLLRSRRSCGQLPLRHANRSTHSVNSISARRCRGSGPRRSSSWPPAAGTTTTTRRHRRRPARPRPPPPVAPRPPPRGGPRPQTRPGRRPTAPSRVASAPAGGDVELAEGDVFVTGSSTVEPISDPRRRARQSRCQAAAWR